MGVTAGKSHSMLATVTTLFLLCMHVGSIMMTDELSDVLILYCACV